METERLIVEVEQVGEFWHAQVCVLRRGSLSLRFPLNPAQAASRDRNKAVSYALTEAAVAFERGQVGNGP